MLKISFHGGAQRVTGACYLIESESTKILVDCGLFQCPKVCEPENYKPFTFDPRSIDAVFVTHAHVDHTGRIPKLYKEGYRGKVYSTPATRDLSQLMLEDSLGLMEREEKRNSDALLFGRGHLDTAFENWEALEYHHEIDIGDFQFRLLDAGHILGSSMIEIITRDPVSKLEKIIVATGDIGNPPTPLLRPTEKVTNANILLIESTYGNRLHEEKSERKIKLERIIEDTIKAGGVLMVPAFSLERTQELLFELNDLVENGRIPQVPVFLDSPLAIRATEVYKKYEHYYNKRARYIIDSGDKLFKFPMLKFTLSTEESKAINDVPQPKIIIAGSGMSTGGRILHHERRYLADPDSTLLMVGYQAAGSRGRRLQDGANSIDIFGDTIMVRARIETLQGYSAHPDRNMLMDFVRGTADTLDKVFAVQGEPDAALFLVQRIRDYLGIEAHAPRLGDSFEL